MHSIEVTVHHISSLSQTGNELLILDVREPWEIEKVSLKGTTRIPLALIVEHQPSLPTTIPLYVICHYGSRSLKVALFLREQGHEAYSIKGGVDAWAREIDASIGFY